MVRSMEADVVEGEGPVKEKSRLEQIEEALNAIERVHLREIVQASSETGTIDEDQLKHVASYIRVVEELLRVMQLREQESVIKNSLSMRLMWEVLLQIPELELLLNDPEIKSRVYQLVRQRLGRG
jgi:dsDNA-specific endonuclease/ATPase MutS2